MKWRQFFTPVSSIDWQEAERMVEQRGADQVVFLDVRQPSEYEASHRPGAVLMPMGELDDRLQELDSNKAIVVY